MSSYEIMLVPASTVNPLLIASQGDPPCLLFNPSTTTNIWISDAQSFTLGSGQSNAIPIRPLGSIVLTNAEGPTYAMTDGAAILMQKSPALQSTPAPSDIALQMVTAGLATASNQTTQNNTATATNTVLNSGIAIPIGAAKDSSVTTVNGTIALGTNPPLAAMNANHAGLHSMCNNPYFTNPTGNADLTGWNASGNTIQTAGANGAVGLPLGSGFINGAFVTPDGAHNFSAIFPVQLIPVKPGQIPYASMLLNMNGGSNSTPALQGVISFQYYNSAGTFIANRSITVAMPNGNTWTKVYAEDDLGAPPNSAGMVITPGYGSVLGGNIAASQTAYITAIIGGVLGQVGTIAGDHARHHAIAGTPLLHGWGIITAAQSAVPANTNVTVPLVFTNPGYVGAIWAAYSGASGTNPFCRVRFRWKDIGTGNFIYDSNSWIIPIGPNASFIPVYIRGPVWSPNVDLIFSNLDTGQPINVFYEISQTTHHMARDDWRGTGATIPTYQPPIGSDMSTNVLTSGFYTLAPGPSSQYLLPLWAGPVSMFQTLNPVAAATLSFTLADSSTGEPLYETVSPTGTGVNVNPTLITLPRRPAILLWTNSAGSGNANAILTIIAQEFVS